MFRVTMIAALTVCLSGSSYAETSSQADFQDFLTAWQGRWVGSIEKDGKKRPSQSVCRTTQGGNAMVTDVTTESWSGTWMVAYDSSSRRIRTFWSSSNGETGQGVMYKEGEIWMLQGKGTSDSGKPETYRNTVTISDGGDGHRWDFYSTVDGVTTTFSSTWKRVESK